MQPPGKRRKPGFRSASSRDEVGAQPVRPALPRVGRHQRNHVEVDAARPVEADAEARAGIGDGRRQRRGDDAPLRRHRRDRGGAGLFEPRVLDPHRQPGRARDAARQHRDDVALPRLDADRSEAVVGDAVAAGLRGEADVVRIRRRRRPIGAHREVTLGVGAGRLLPAHERFRELERAVLDLLRIEAAVGGEVDVLEEDAVHGRGDRHARLIGRHRDLGDRDDRRLRHAAPPIRLPAVPPRARVCVVARLPPAVGSNRHYTARNGERRQVSVNVHVLGHIGSYLRHHRRELEAVARAGADEDDGRVVRVAIDQEVAVRRVGVAADRGAHRNRSQRRAGSARRRVRSRRHRPPMAADRSPRAAR